jgi:hypothetical protein
MNDRLRFAVCLVLAAQVMHGDPFSLRQYSRIGFIPRRYANAMSKAWISEFETASWCSTSTPFSRCC